MYILNGGIVISKKISKSNFIWGVFAVIGILTSVWWLLVLTVNAFSPNVTYDKTYCDERQIEDVCLKEYDSCAENCKIGIVDNEPRVCLENCESGQLTVDGCKEWCRMGFGLCKQNNCLIIKKTG